VSDEQAKPEASTQERVTEPAQAGGLETRKRCVYCGFITRDGLERCPVCARILQAVI